MVFAPYTPLALRAEARPPLPPPITRKSHSFGVGAIVVDEVENWREKADSLVFASLEGLTIRRKGVKVDSLTAMTGSWTDVLCGDLGQGL